MDIHAREQKIRAALLRLEKRTDITENKATIRRNMDHNYARGLSQARVHKYLTTLPGIAAFLGKDFELAEKADIQHVVAEVEQRPWSRWTKRDCVQRSFVAF